MNVGVGCGLIKKSISSSRDCRIISFYCTAVAHLSSILMNDISFYFLGICESIKQIQLLFQSIIIKGLHLLNKPLSILSQLIFHLLSHLQSFAVSSNHIYFIDTLVKDRFQRYQQNTFPYSTVLVTHSFSFTPDVINHPFEINSSALFKYFTVSIFVCQL